MECCHLSLDSYKEKKRALSAWSIKRYLISSPALLPTLCKSLQLQYCVSGTYGGAKGSHFEANVGSHLTCFLSLICICRESLQKQIQIYGVWIIEGVSITALRIGGCGVALAWAPFWMGSELPWHPSQHFEECIGNESECYMRMVLNSFQQFYLW